VPPGSLGKPASLCREQLGLRRTQRCRGLNTPGAGMSWLCGFGAIITAIIYGLIRAMGASGKRIDGDKPAV